MDPDKSSNSSSFEDLSNLNENNMNTSGVGENITSMNGNNFNDKTKSTTKNNEEIKKSLLSSSIDNNKKEDKEDDDFMDLIGNGQITKKILKRGYLNEQPHSRDFVKVSYKGILEDGTVVENFEEVEIQVGDFEVVQGLDMTIPFMKVGEKAKVHVSSRFAYGSKGLKNETDSEKFIPPHTNVDYEIELLNLRPEHEDKDLTFEIRKELGNRKRERANFWYNRNEFSIAIQLYRRALEYLGETSGGGSSVDDNTYSNEELQSLLDDRIIIYNNLAMAQIKINAYDVALQSVETVLRYQPSNSKALFRKGRILDVKGDTKGAIALLQKAATLEPDSRSIQIDLAKLIIKNRREELIEKEMYQKMLGQARRLEETKKSSAKQIRKDFSRMKLFCYIMGSILIGVAGVAVYRYKYN